MTMRNVRQKEIRGTCTTFWRLWVERVGTFASRISVTVEEGNIVYTIL
jgi:hypothetical protein